MLIAERSDVGRAGYDASVHFGRGLLDSSGGRAMWMLSRGNASDYSVKFLVRPTLCGIDPYGSRNYIVKPINNVYR